MQGYNLLPHPLQPGAGHKEENWVTYPRKHALHGWGVSLGSDGSQAEGPLLAQTF